MSSRRTSLPVISGRVGLTPAEVETMTDEQLRTALVKYGETVGPIVNTTRDLYKRKLIAILTSKGNIPSGMGTPATSSTRTNATVSSTGSSGGRHTASTTASMQGTRKGDPSVIAEVIALSNEEIREVFRRYGKDPGPVVASTRHTYEKKLIKLRTRELRAATGDPCEEFSSDDEDMEWLPA